jgi:hypothetical protein
MDSKSKDSRFEYYLPDHSFFLRMGKGNNKIKNKISFSFHTHNYHIFSNFLLMECFIHYLIIQYFKVNSICLRWCTGRIKFEKLVSPLYEIVV